ncbi:MAG: leucine-rich repeat domain-containing protein, partial [Treponema sp.]|nr:leucine-rich repeat domain-containing protein [Treponema sp.]
MLRKRILLAAALIGIAAMAFAQSEDDFTVTIPADGTGAVITGYTGKATDVRIPAQIQGIPVREIGDRAFNSNRNITGVIIPDTVITIADSAAFGGCSK